MLILKSKHYNNIMSWGLVFEATTRENPKMVDHACRDLEWRSGLQAHHVVFQENLKEKEVKQTA